MIIQANARARVPRLGYICPSCRLAQRRSVSTTFLQKMEEGRKQWALQAEAVDQGRQPSPLKILEDRGFVHMITGDRDKFDRLLIDKRVGVYCGIDPTAPSLHVGHMLPLMALFWMHVMGFHTVSVIGAATARIGDPTGRSKDRPEMSSTERKANIVGLHYQLKKIWSNLEVTAQRHGFNWNKHWHRELVNNAVWWNKIPFVDVLKYLGKGLRIHDMLRKDTVKNKMDESTGGMSYAEFSYPLMQAWDWWYMYDTKNVQVQIGGADQYGNITAGVDAVKYMARTHPDPDVRQEGGVSPKTTPFGLTVPLLTNSAGQKFGKSAGNAVWLDDNMTELWQLYAFFVKTADADVERYLKMFTFLPLDSIAKIMQEHQGDTSKQVAQKTLAYEFCDLVHGGEKAGKAKTRYENLSAARKSTSLETLLSVSTDEELASHYARDVEPAPQAGENPLMSHVLKREQQRGTFASPKLNPYAPTADPNQLSGSTKHVVLPKSLIHGQSIAKILYSAGLVSSRSEGHRLAQAQGAYLGKKSSGRGQMTEDLQFVPAKLADPGLTWSFVIHDNEHSGTMDKPGEEGLLILRTGKWKMRIIRIVSDERFRDLGLPDPPGWQEFQSVEVATRAQFQLDKGIKPPGHTQGPPPPEDRPSVVDEPFVEPTQHFSRHEKNKARHEQVQKGWAFFNDLQNRPLQKGLRTDSNRQSRDRPEPAGSREPGPRSLIFPWESKPHSSVERRRQPVTADRRRDLTRSENNLAEGRFADESPPQDEYGYEGYAADEYRYEYRNDHGAGPPPFDPEASLTDKKAPGPPRDEQDRREWLEAGYTGPRPDDEPLPEQKLSPEEELARDEERRAAATEKKEARKAFESERKRLIEGWRGNRTRTQGQTSHERASWWRTPGSGPGKRRGSGGMTQA